MYTLSRDYGKLFDLLCAGHVLVGWVRYSKSLRDVVKIERRAEFDIYIGVRGICYTDLGTFDREKGEERDVFAARCKSVDLEWIEPSVPRAEVAALRAQFHTQAEQRDFVGKLVDNMPHAQIAAEFKEFKAEVADALAALRDGYTKRADGEGASIPWRAATDLARQELDVTIAALGLPEPTAKENQ